MSSQNNRLGFIIALIGGAVALLAFFALPFAGYGPVSFTLVQIAGYPNEQVIWLVAVFAVAIVVIAALPMRSSTQVGTKKVAAGILIGMTGLLVLQVVIAFVIVNGETSYSSESATSVLGIGFWLYVLAMVAVLIGGIIEAARKVVPVVGMQMQGPAAAWQAPPLSMQPPVLPAPGVTQYPPAEPYRQPWAQGSPTPAPAPSYQPPYQPNQPNQQYQQPSQYQPGQQPPGAAQWPPSQQAAGGSSPQWTSTERAPGGSSPQYPATERGPQWPPSQPNQ